MPSYRETLHLRYTPDQMFTLVADIERYPEFLPWCTGAAIRAREEAGDTEILIVDMSIAYQALCERYSSRVTLSRKTGTIEAKHIRGPFETLDTKWCFSPEGEGSTITFAIVFAFRSRSLSAMASLAFDPVARRMANAFVERAKILYGDVRTSEI